jgi:hypothetical protein
MRRGIGLALVLGLLAAPSAAGAYVIGGKRWPGRTITYYNGDKKLKRPVELAVRAWNTSGVRIRFRPVSRARAQVVIRPGGASITPFSSSEFDSGACSGFADLGWWPGRRQAHVTLDRGCFGLLVSTEVVVHELGHILGLNHPSRGCSVMTASPYLFCRSQPKEWEYRCRYLRADDLRGAVRLYGGRVKRSEDFCALWSAPGAPAGLTVAPDGRSVRWRNPPLPKPSLKEFGKPRVEASLDLRSGDCAKRGELSPIVQPVVIDPGREQTLSTDGLAPNRPGIWCYTLQLSDRFGRGGVAHTTVTVPNLPPAVSFDVSGNGDGNCVEAVDSSSDPDGQITSWWWDFGAPADMDNTSTAPGYAGHCYSQPGTYTVMLTVTDDAGGRVSGTRTVTVEPPPPPPE